MKTEGCWLWTGSTVRGYGQICIGRTPDGRQRNVSTHRWAWEHFNGPIPDGLMVCHHCDNPPCVNPNHLFLGDAKANNQDASAKGHYHVSRNTKLTLAERLEIFHAPRDRKTGRFLARKFGVSKVAIAHTRAGRFVGSPLDPSFAERATDSLDAVFERVPVVYLPVRGEVS